MVGHLVGVLWPSGFCGDLKSLGRQPVQHEFRFLFCFFLFRGGTSQDALGPGPPPARSAWSVRVGLLRNAFCSDTVVSSSIQPEPSCQFCSVQYSQGYRLVLGWDQVVGGYGLLPLYAESVVCGGFQHSSRAASPYWQSVAGSTASGNACARVALSMEAALSALWSPSFFGLVAPGKLQCQRRVCAGGSNEQWGSMAQPCQDLRPDASMALSGGLRDSCLEHSWLEPKLLHRGFFVLFFAFSRSLLLCLLQGYGKGSPPPGHQAHPHALLGRPQDLC